ncbi:MAG: hypothetical protein P0Y64_16830 [Candidatus Sphingomonas colombiensis]|nr:hypothetical protein [Sphingomonas sp.]WEK42985.1 MAG: hypothetical protein P0Y64_16830 [Sphingomonas sp.]
MSEVVDSIIASLEVRLGNYVRDFNAAADAHERFTKTRPDKVGEFSPQQVEQYANRHKKASLDIVKGEEDATAKVTRTRKARADVAVAQDEREVRSAKVSAKAKADAEIAEAQRSARYRDVAARAATRGGVRQATNSSIGATIAREGSGQRSIPSSVLNAAPEVAAEREINYLLAAQAELQTRLTFARGRDRDIIREQLGEIRLRTQLEKAGLDETAIALRLEERRLLIAREQTVQKRSDLTHNAGRFAEGAGIGRFGGSGAAVAGIATAVGVGVGVAAISSAIEYGKALDNLSKQLGITTGDMQAYLKIAHDTGVEQAALSSAFGQFASNLGRAQQGSQEQAKVFKALGVDIKNFSSAGDALPTVIDRISQLKDPLQRAAIETRLFGEEGRKLDPLLSGGAAKVSALAASLQETGKALSQKEIQDLDETARKLADVKNQLSVDFARIVSGNADAIIGLADAFGKVASKITGAIQKYTEWAALQAQGGALASFTSDNDRKGARDYLLNSRSGRVKLFADAETRERDLTAGNGSFKTGAGAPSFEQQRNKALAAVRAEKTEIAAREAASREAATPDVQSGAVDRSLLSKLGAPKGPKGKSAEQLERAAEQRTRQFNDQLASAQQEFLRAQQQMTGDIDKRADIEQQLLQAAHDVRLADIESQRKRNVLAGADAGLEKARADQLSAAENQAHAANKETIEQERRLDKERSLTTAASTLLDVQQTLLSAQFGMAKTIAERRDIELKLLANAKEQERTRLQGVIDSAKPGDPAAADAKTRLGTLDQRYDAQRQEANYRNRSPLDQYRDSLPRTADQMNEALDNVKVNGLRSLDDAITNSISKVFKLGGAFGEVANQIISDLIRIGVERAIIGPIADALFGGAGSGGAGGALTSILGGRASGGNVVGGGAYIVGENGPEVVKFGQSGKVYPNGSIPNIGAGGGSSVTQYITVDGRNSVTPGDFASQILTQANAHANRAAAMAGRTAVEASPGRITRVQTLGN